MPFALHPTLARDTVLVSRLPLCRVLLMKDRRFPWLILVPERDSVREIYELPPGDRAELVEEIARASEVLQQLFQPDKLNVGALGNVVPQLHVHVVARFAADPAWPGPVWGSGPAEPYADSELEEIRGQLVSALESKAETFEVPPELEAELSESIAEADRGETISADELLKRLRRVD
jgi:diadenosine tetraphosphate (Ap4A) HIT family hydrolase